MPKIGIQSGAHLLNCLSGGHTLQHATNHVGRGQHKLHVLVNNVMEEVYVPSKHQELMVSGSTGLTLGWATEAFFKKGQNFERRYNTKERRESFDDEEIIFYEHTNALCVEFNPAEGNEDCKNAFFDLTWQAINSKL